jgi:N-acyl-D-amino-acid deacylase
MRTFAYGGPVEWTSFADHLSWLSRQGHSQNLAWFVGHNTVRYAAGVFGAQAPEQELRAMEDFVREAMHAGALGLSTGLEFNPGRLAPPDELVRLNKVVGEYDGYYTSHIRNRDSQLQESIEEFLTIIREGKTHGEISHLNVRNRTGAAPGAWQRAVDTMQTAREVEGIDVLADTTPFKDGLGQMAGKAAGRRRVRGCATRAPASGCATSATATGGSSTAASGTARDCSRANSSRSSRGRTSTKSQR